MRLVGVGIGNPPTDGVMVGIRIHLVLLGVVEIYPDIRQFVPTRDAFSAEITAV